MDVKPNLTSPSEKVEEKIKVFEKATITEKIKLHPPKIEKIFLAVDSHSEASKISENAIQIALNLASRFEAEVYIFCTSSSARELVESEKLVNKTVKLFESKKVSVIGGCSIGYPSEKVLELSEQFDPSLVIMPIPYGERAETFEIESLGATVDLVIRKSKYPILLVRKALFSPTELTKNILILIENEKENIKAAEWALILGEQGSKLKLLSITEKEIVKKVEGIAQAIESSKLGKEVLAHSHKKEIQPLINGIIDEAKNRRIELKRIHLVGNKTKLILEEAENNHTLIVVSSSLINGKILRHEVENLARFSKTPTLIVKN
jgi:nucleotide-binding universal stress UspA family protein